MAVDTAVKRRAALIAARGLWWLDPLPLPDGSVDTIDRMALLGVYPTIRVFPSPVCLTISDTPEADLVLTDTEVVTIALSALDCNGVPVSDDCYDVGDNAILRAEFKAGDPRVLTDPDDVVVIIQPPAPAAAYDEIPDNPSVGVYVHEVEVDASGEWSYRFEGTGGIRGAGEGSFIVRRQLVSMPTP